MEVDGCVGPDLHAARGNEGRSVRTSTNVWEYGLSRKTTSSHRVCVCSTFTESWDWRSEALPWLRMSRLVYVGGTFTDIVLTPHVAGWRVTVVNDDRRGRAVATSQAVAGLFRLGRPDLWLG